MEMFVIVAGSPVPTAYNRDLWAEMIEARREYSADLWYEMRAAKWAYMADLEFDLRDAREDEVEAGYAFTAARIAAEAEIPSCLSCHGTPTDHALFGCPPRDYCRHGVYVGGCGADYMCGACENGEEWDEKDMEWVDAEQPEERK